ncbi:hypothetical protein BMETH_1456_0 [methanotrophic bacterial endosymbiont of Bathymodiolus sp.]|nr:hypothetical protein BMETH_1456_0 [methanotrophic bacterial endosymbiont of Bathymodiolus sp.]
MNSLRRLPHIILALRLPMIFRRSLKDFPLFHPWAISFNTSGLSNFVNTPPLICWVSKGHARSRASVSSTIEIRLTAFD